MFEMPPSPHAAPVPGVDQVDGEGMHEQEPPQSPMGSGVAILESHRLWCSWDAAGPEPGFV